MKCTKILSLFLLLIFGICFVLASQTDRTIKRIKFRKWFSKRLFEKAKVSFDRARNKVDQANEMVLLAKALVETEKKPKKPKGETINNENTFQQLIISKLGHFKDLTNAGQLLLGIMVGDFLPNLKKPLPKKKAIQFVVCASNRTIVEKESPQLLKTWLRVDVNLGKEIVEGHKIFEKRIPTAAKSTITFKKLFGKKIKTIKAFIRTIRDVTITIMKNAQTALKGYYRCIKELNKDKVQSKKLWQKILKTKFNFSKYYECNASPSHIFSRLRKKKRALGLFNRIWNKLIKTYFIEKKPDRMNWYKAGKAIGGISSMIIKPVCVSKVKKMTMKKWKSKYFKK